MFCLCFSLTINSVWSVHSQSYIHRALSYAPDTERVRSAVIKSGKRPFEKSLRGCSYSSKLHWASTRSSPEEALASTEPSQSWGNVGLKLMRRPTWVLWQYMIGRVRHFSATNDLSRHSFSFLQRWRYGKRSEGRSKDGDTVTVPARTLNEEWLPVGNGGGAAAGQRCTGSVCIFMRSQKAFVL